MIGGTDMAFIDIAKKTGRVLAVTVAVLAAVSLTSGPGTAYAQRGGGWHGGGGGGGWHGGGGWGGGGWGGGGWGWGRPYFYYRPYPVFYRPYVPPPVYVEPQPAYYVPPPPVVYPYHRRAVVRHYRRAAAHRSCTCNCCPAPASTAK
jgi:hypothetical protein